MIDIWNKIKNIVGTVAPILGNAIIPCFGGTAGSLIAKALDCDPNKPEDIEKILLADKKSLLKLKELENKHEEFLLNLGFENNKLYLTNIQSARQREIDTVKATSKYNWPLYIIASVIFISFFITMFLLFKIPLIVVNKDIIVYTIGALQSAFITIVAYFFGSSKGSSEKNEILSKTINKGDTK